MSAFPTPHRRHIAVAVAVVLLVVGIVVALLMTSTPQDQVAEDTDRSTEVASSPQETTPTTSASSPTATSGTEAQHSGPPADVAAARRANAGKAPALAGQFRMTGPAPVSGATYDSMPYALPLNPAGPQDTMVRWVDGWGQSPATAEAGTTYILGHAWGAAPLVFNPISEAVTAAVDTSTPTGSVTGTDGKPVKRWETPTLNGAMISMYDNHGRSRNWKVTNSWLVDKNEAIVDPDVMADQRPGRIVLIACSVSGAHDLGFNVIVEGQLV